VLDRGDDGEKLTYLRCMVHGAGFTGKNNRGQILKFSGVKPLKECKGHVLFYD
jgi:hypothetical protein